jgi:hypothetical protein
MKIKVYFSLKIQINDNVKGIKWTSIAKDLHLTNFCSVGLKVK